MKGKDGLTQLNCFANNGMISSLNRMLLMKGIDVESRDVNGNTPLINAAFKGRVEIAEILISHGAKIEGMTWKGYVPLFAACYSGHLPVVNLLISKGGNLVSSTNVHMPTRLSSDCQSSS